MVQSSPPACAGSNSLTDSDRAHIARARAVLAEPHGCELADMAARIGALEWHLGELLRLAGRLGG